MAMSPCSECFNNIWNFELIEGIVIATCQMCDNEVQFSAKKKVYVDKPPKRAVHEWIDGIWHVNGRPAYLKQNKKFTKIIT